MSHNLVCLTIDDGPSAFRPATLQLLRDLGVPVAFFDVGMRVRANPRLTRFAAREGHQVLSHTYTHPALTSLSAAGVRGEVLRTGRALQDAGVEVPFLAVRPPMLASADWVRDELAGLGYVEIGGNLSPADWNPATSAAQIRDQVLDNVTDGSVMVMHDGPVNTGAGSATLEALPEIVAGVRERGLAFGLLDEVGGIVPATYASSGLAVPALQAPVPYRPLMIADPAPPDPWVPVTFVDSAEELMAQYFADLEQGDVTRNLTADVVWVDHATRRRVRGRASASRLARSLRGRMTDVRVHTYVVTDDSAVVEGDYVPAAGALQPAPDTAAVAPVPYVAVYDLAPDGIYGMRMYTSAGSAVVR